MKTRAAPGAGLVAMRQGVDMTTSHRNRTVLNHDSATDGSPHDEHDAEARRSGGTGDIFPCGAHADAVGAVLARQALEGAPAGVIGSLVRGRGVLVRGRGVTALGSPSARRRRSRICGATSIGIGVASGRLGADARVPGDRGPAGAGDDRALRRLGPPGVGGAFVPTCPIVVGVSWPRRPRAPGTRRGAVGGAGAPARSTGRFCDPGRMCIWLEEAVTAFGLETSGARGDGGGS